MESDGDLSIKQQQENLKCKSSKHEKFTSKFTANFLKANQQPRSGESSGSVAKAKQETVVKSQFQCTFCHKLVSSKPVLEIHLRSHIGERPFFCKLCPFEAPQKDSLKYHNLTCHPSAGKTIQCSTCGKRFFTKNSLRCHSKIHLPVKPYKCSICQKGFSYKRNMVSHYEHAHSSERPFQCEICHKRFKSKNNCKKHFQKHSGQKLHQCDLCNLRFTENVSLKRHIKRIHAKDGKFVCFICGQICLVYVHLETHIRSHTLEKPHFCKKCDYEAVTKGRLKEHMSIHNSERVRNYQCELCSRGFFTRSELIGHIQAHTEERPHKCLQCALTFKTSVALKNHSVVHSKLRPHKCYLCELSFKQEVVLNLHIQNHIGERWFSCGICGERHTQSSHLTRHLQTHNNEKVGQKIKIK